MNKEQWAALSDGERLKLIVQATAFRTALRFWGDGVRVVDDSELELWHEYSIRMVRTQYDDKDQRQYVVSALRAIEQRDVTQEVTAWYDRLVARMDKRKRKAFLLTPQY